MQPSCVQKTLDDLFSHLSDLVRALVVFEIDDVVRSTSQVFDVELTFDLPDRFDGQCADVVIAAGHAKDVTGDASTGYAARLDKPGVMKAVDHRYFALDVTCAHLNRMSTYYLVDVIFVVNKKFSILSCVRVCS